MYLEVKDLKKSYGEGGGYVQVLKGITAGVEQGEMCVIQGTSGSGKSTLLNCIGGLDTVDSGSIVVDGQEVRGLTVKHFPITVGRSWVLFSSFIIWCLI
jgi:putative ABC transport system ATP-binding protein